MSGTTLLVIDVQKDGAYWGGNRNNPQFEKNLALLLETWREHELPIIHIQHDSVPEASPLHPSKSTNAPSDFAIPKKGEVTFRKHVNSSFIGTDLKNYLDLHKVRSLVITGLTTNHCVETTTRMAGNYGYDTYLVTDATATFDRKGPNGKIYSAQDIHDMTMSNLNGEFATIITTKKIIDIVTSDTK